MAKTKEVIPAVQPRQSAPDKARILRRLPPAVSRIQVIDNAGSTRFKAPADIEDDDHIVLKSNGDPVIMLGQPGRKSKIDLPPVNDAVGEVLDAKVDHLSADKLVGLTKTTPEGDDVINLLLQALSEEAASLEFERKEAERLGRDTTAISVKRSRILKTMADIWMKRKERLEGGLIDLNAPSFGVLFSFILETFRGSLEDAGLRSEHVETVFQKLQKRISDGWREEAKARMREGK